MAGQPAPASEAAAARGKLHAAIGQVALALSVVPRYRHCALAELQSLVVEPLLRGRLAIATGKPTDAGAETDGALAGIAIWASLSDEADQRLREQIAAGVFPVRLNPADWTSGDKVWLLDVIAPTRQLASAVLANLRQALPSDELSVHPMAAAQVERTMLEAMRKDASSAGA
jgi:hemolysin-activating ACP:hemolysin acyltransferase